MTDVRHIGRAGVNARNSELYLASLTSLDEWPGTITEPAGPFVVFTALDATRFTDDQLVEFTGKLIAQGCVYSCSWGPDCSRVHDCFDTADLERVNWLADDSIVMSTWHEDESLDEALWFAVFAAYNDDAETDAVLAISQAEWATQIEERFADPEQLNEDVVSEDDRPQRPARIPWWFRYSWTRSVFVWWKVRRFQ